MALQQFLDLMNDAAKWHIETDEGGTTHTIVTTDAELRDLAAAVGVRMFFAETTEDCIQRAIDAGPSA